MSRSPVRQQSRLRLADHRRRAIASGSTPLLVVWLSGLLGWLRGTDRRRRSNQSTGRDGRSRELRTLQGSEGRRGAKPQTTGRQAQLSLVADKSKD